MATTTTATTSSPSASDEGSSSPLEPTDEILDGDISFLDKVSSLPPLAKNFPKPPSDPIEYSSGHNTMVTNTSSSKPEEESSEVEPTNKVTTSDQTAPSTIAIEEEGSNEGATTTTTNSNNNNNRHPLKNGMATNVMSFFQKIKHVDDAAKQRNPQAPLPVEEERQETEATSTNDNNNGNGNSNSNDPSSSSSQQSNTETTEFVQTDLPPTILSSCDKHEPVLQINNNQNNRRNRFETFFTTARKIDQMRTPTITSTANNNNNNSNSNSSTEGPTNDNASQSSNNELPTAQERKLVEDKTLDDILRENKRLTFDQATNKLLTDLRRRIKDLQSQKNISLNENKDLKERLKDEADEKKRLVKEAKKELEERNMKLAVLEEHFVALNEHAPSFDSVAELSYDTVESLGMDRNDDDVRKTFSEDDGLVSDEASESTNGVDKGSTGNNNDASSPTSSSGNNVNNTRLTGSIIKLDKSTLSELKLSLKVTTKELELVKKKYVDCKKSSEEEKDVLEKRVEDLTDQLKTRDISITDLERSLKQMKEARFKQKSKSSSHKRRATVGNMHTLASASTNSSVCDGASVDGDDSSINTNRTSTLLPSEEVINEAVKKALEAKEKEHAAQIESLKDHLELKDRIVKKMESKLSALKNNTMTQHRRSPSRQQMTEFTIVRNMSIMNGMMDTTVERLESMLKQLDQSVEDGTAEKSALDVPDELAPIRRLMKKVSLLSEEVKLSMKLVEQGMVNKIESIKMEKFEEKKEGGNEGEEVVVSGQSSAEGATQSTSSQSESLSELIGKAHSDSRVMMQEMETSMTKAIDDVKDRLQDVEDEMNTKQDMVEALELALSEQVENYRALQDQMDAMKAKMDNYADNAMEAEIDTI